MITKCARIWDEVRDKNPLIHCITNYVTVNNVANVLIASGASPAMVEHPEQTGGFAALSSAVYINLGTLTTGRELGMLKAVRSASDKKIPIIIDPVGCGVIPQVFNFLNQLSAAGDISVIKGNTAEIKSLAGVDTLVRGVDSLDDGQDIDETCLQLAKTRNCLVIATGKTDCISDGKAIVLVNNGTPMFQAITGAGCMAGAIVAACAAVAEDEPVLAAASALSAFNIAGEQAARESGPRPGTFGVLLLDYLYQLRGQDLIKEGNIIWQ